MGLFCRRASCKQAGHDENDANDDERMNGREGDFDGEPQHQPGDDEQDSKDMQDSHGGARRWMAGLQLYSKLTPAAEGVENTRIAP